MYKFKVYGHENITARHKTTLEFTKDRDLSLKGDCIVGVRADFDLISLKKFIKTLKSGKIRIIIESKLDKSGSVIKSALKKINYKKIIKEEINAEINPDFNINDELVIRKTDFISERTFAIKADKAAFELNKNAVNILKDKKNMVVVSIESR